MYKSPQSPKVAELSWSGTPSAASYTYSMSIDQQTASFVSISSGTDINLGSGHYYVVAYPDYTRANSTIRNQIYWFLDGSQIGAVGGSDHFNSESTDNAEAPFTVLTSGVLTLRQTAWSGSAITLTNQCKAFIYKVPL
jgi:hypothetical protein